MAVCVRIFPPTVSDFAEIPDFETLLSTDPTTAFNRDELRTLNVLNNVLLNNSDLTDYPNLASRIAQGATTDQEFADFLLDSGLTTDSVKESFLNDFPVPISYDAVKQLVDSVVAAAAVRPTAEDINSLGDNLGTTVSTAVTSGSTSGVSGATGTAGVTGTTGTGGVTGATGTTGVTGTTGTGGVTGATGTTSVTETQIAALNEIISSGAVSTNVGVSLADGVSIAAISAASIQRGSVQNFPINTGSPIITSQDTSEVTYNVSGVGNTPAELWNPGTAITDFFTLQEEYYNENFGAGFNKKACGGFSNPFEKLIKAVSAIGAAQDLAASLKGLSGPDALAALAAGPLAGIAGNLTNLVNTATGIADNLTNLAGSVTGIADNLTEKIEDLVSGIKKGDLLQGLANDFTNLVKDVTEFANLEGTIKSLTKQLGTFQNDLLNLVDDVAKTMQAKVGAIANKAKQFFSEVKELPKGVFKFVTKKIEQVKRLFTKTNLDKIKGKVNDFFSGNLGQFEDLVPDALNLLLLKSCGLSGLIENFMKGPVDGLKGSVDNLLNIHSVMSGQSASLRNAVVAAGGIRLSPEQRRTESRAGVENYNRSRTAETQSRAGTGDTGQWDLPSGYISPEVTDEERALLDEITGDGLSGYFSFVRRNVSEMGKRATEKYESAKDDPRAFSKRYPKSGNVYYHGEVYDAERNFHDAEADIDAGWKMIIDKNPELFIKLKRVAERLKNEGYISGELQVNSAYRSPYYNYFLTGGAESSNHMACKALDIGITFKGDEAEAAFIRACSEEGFLRIVKYNTFFHIDVGPGSRTNYWMSKGKLGRLALAAWNTHARG